MIPILDLTKQYQTLQPEIDAAVRAVFSSGTFINGPNVKAFEDDLARYVGTAHAVGLNSGTDALHLALRALDIGPGDEVITSPFTFVATTEAIGIVGAKPVFVDIDPLTLNIDPSLIEAAITSRTRAILPVHLYGHPAPMEQILKVARRHGVSVIEDCAQAIGAEINGKRVGSFGDVGCFSFFPSKNLGAFGDGGMATTDSETLAKRMRSLRAHGGRVKYHHEELGVNSRLDEVQAAILRVKLPHLDSWIERRQAVAQAYRMQLAKVAGMTLPAPEAGLRHVYHQFTIRTASRELMQSTLAANGIQTMIYYPVPLHLQEVHRDLGHGIGDFPLSEQAAGEVLSLPMYPELPRSDVEFVADAVLSSLEPSAV